MIELRLKLAQDGEHLLLSSPEVGYFTCAAQHGVLLSPGVLHDRTRVHDRRESRRPIATRPPTSLQGSGRRPSIAAEERPGSGSALPPPERLESPGSGRSPQRHMISSCTSFETPSVRRHCHLAIPCGSTVPIGAPSRQIRIEVGWSRRRGVALTWLSAEGQPNTPRMPSRSATNVVDAGRTGCRGALALPRTGNEEPEITTRACRLMGATGLEPVTPAV